MQVLKADHDKAIAGVAVSACGRWLAAVKYTVAVDVFDRGTGRIAFTHEGRSGTWGAAFGDPGGWLLVWGKTGLTGYHPPDFTPVALVAEPVEAAAAAGGRLVALFRRAVGGELVCWTVTAGGLRQRWAATTKRAGGRLTFDPTGRWLAAADWSVAMLRAADDGRTAATSRGPAYADLWGLVDERRALFGGSKHLELYDVPAERTVATLGLLGRGPVRAAVSPDGRSVAASAFASLYLLSVEPLAIRHRYHFHTRGKPTCVAFAPDGLTAAAGTSRGEVVVWDLD